MAKHPITCPKCGDTFAADGRAYDAHMPCQADIYTDVKTVVAKQAKSMTHPALVRQWRDLANQINSGMSSNVQLGAAAALAEEINRRGLDVDQYK